MDGNSEYLRKPTWNICKQIDPASKNPPRSISWGKHRDSGLPGLLSDRGQPAQQPIASPPAPLYGEPLFQDQAGIFIAQNLRDTSGPIKFLKQGREGRWAPSVPPSCPGLHGCSALALNLGGEAQRLDLRENCDESREWWMEKGFHLSVVP